MAVHRCGPHAARPGCPAGRLRRSIAIMSSRSRGSVIASRSAAGRVLARAELSTIFAAVPPHGVGVLGDHRRQQAGRVPGQREDQPVGAGSPAGESGGRGGCRGDRPPRCWPTAITRSGRPWPRPAHMGRRRRIPRPRTGRMPSESASWRTSSAQSVRRLPGWNAEVPVSGPVRRDDPDRQPDSPGHNPGTSSREPGRPCNRNSGGPGHRAVLGVAEDPAISQLDGLIYPGGLDQHVMYSIAGANGRHRRVCVIVTPYIITRLRE